MIARAAGALLLGLGAAMAAMPAFGWYTAPPVGAPTHASGFSGAGQLWLLPFLGAVVVLAGALQLSARPSGAAATARVAGAQAAASAPATRAGRRRCPRRSTSRPPPS